MVCHTPHQMDPSYLEAVKTRTTMAQRLTNLDQAADIFRRDGTGGSVLDLGCASGYLYNYIGDMIENYTGVDLEPAYLEVGREHYADQPGDRFRLIQGDATDLDLPGPYDTVFCLGLLYFLPDFRQYLARLFSLGRRLIIIRSLFGEQGRTRWVPAHCGQGVHNYCNIYGYAEVTAFALERGWRAAWERDRYIATHGMQWDTGPDGMEYPFAFLVLAREETPGRGR